MSLPLTHVVATRDELMAAGMTARDLTAAVRSGALIRLRRALYCLPDTDPVIQSALRTGGRLDCVTALRHLGIWVTGPVAEPHVRVAPNASRLNPGSAHVHWNPTLRAGALAVVDPLDALLVALSCQRPIDAIASVDSAVRQGLVSLSQLRTVGPGLGVDLREVDGRADSGLESLLRVVLRRLGLRVEIQVTIPGVGRVDLLVEGIVIVETDGRAFHAGARRHVDHQRDAAAAAQGYTPLRFDAHQVHTELASVVMAVLGALRAHRGAHFSGQEAERVRRRLEKMLGA